MSVSLLLFAVFNHVLQAVDRRRRRGRSRRRTEQGQATAEYALVLLGAAAVALALVSWVGRGRVSSFFDAIFDHLMAAAK